MTNDLKHLVYYYWNVEKAEVSLVLAIRLTLAWSEVVEVFFWSQLKAALTTISGY